jgi:predicted  nucleic acid-binding Zn-ribbon protein
MLNNLFDPVILFIVGVSAISILLVMQFLSIYYYCKAKDLAPYLMQKEELQKDIATSQTTIAELREEIRKYNDELAKANRIISEGNAAQVWLETNAPKVEALKIEVDSLKVKLKDANDAYEKRQGELNTLVQDVANKYEELKTITMQKNDAEMQTKRATDEKKLLDSEINRLKADRRELVDEISKLTGQKNKLDAEVKDLEEKKKQRDTTVSELSKAKNELNEIEGQANAAKKILSEWNHQETMNADRWKDLDRPYIDSSTRKITFVDEKEWLNIFAKLLQENEISFNERIIKAFHTGLKCADRSPLVVLAGISGTGKSLLPELYAVAIGMNYLPIAVQPRWDSPQDLFGFYNYMEGRYKATELSRLLWQFDIYNNPSAKSEYSNNDTLPMNLVLLDEMNLARVEYYFSDLLSKLEVRRGLALDDREQRWKAEIELECNSSAKNEQTRRLFVGMNSLFIGTMNEDESTQTLSDKVLDRSNVLRFGRPKQLGMQPKKEEFMNACKNLPMVNFENWYLWQTEDSERSEETMRLIAPINEALEKVGRPFAHRAWHAIKGYVSFYPGNSQSAFNDALADQIEMKILPKLNGLELDATGFEDVKAKLSEVIEKLGDDGLKDAFNKACTHQDQSFFKWRGVMR